MTETSSIFELKEVNDDGSFVGIASVYGVEDLGGDVIEKGAFKKTISENPAVPILWQHKSDEVIGMGTVKEWQGKVLLEGQLDLDDPTAMKAYKKMKSKLIKGLSIGFNTIKHTWEDVEGRMVRHITELKLWEVSVVTFPMLPSAQVTRVKSGYYTLPALTEEQCLRAARGEDPMLTPDQEAGLRMFAEMIRALPAKNTTPPPEPVHAVEPPVVSPEPEALHSWLSETLAEYKARLASIQ